MVLCSAFLLIKEYLSINLFLILGVSFGLNLPLLKFWKRAGFVPVYLRQSVCDITGEHTCIMLKDLNKGTLYLFLLLLSILHLKKNIVCR